jgi:hypothetical protein
VAVLWNQGVHTDTEVTANKPDIIIKNKKEKTCILIDGQYQRTEMSHKWKQKETKLQEFIYIDTTNVGHEMYDYTSGNWSHRNSNERFKEKFRNHTRKTFNRFAAEDSYTSNITRNAESTAV